jgi:lambda repressor-like predicted transcriptional regulator
MDAKIKRRVAIGAAGLAVAAGGGIAYAATQSPGAADRQAILNDAAQRLNVSPDRLQSALQGAYSDQIDKALAAGRITRAQADKLKQGLKDEGVPLVPPGAGGFFFRERGFDVGGAFFGGLDAAAQYLGLSRSDLVAQLRSGKSLAAVARAQGKSVGGLESAIKDAVRAQLDKAVAAKKITAAQEQQMLTKIDGALGDIVQGTLPEFHGGGFVERPFAFGFGGPFLGGLNAAAKYLGMSRSDLVTQLRSGKSLADVAKAQGKSVSGLESAIKDAVKARLDKAVAAKRITSSEEQDILSKLDPAITGLVEGDAIGAVPRHKFFLPAPPPSTAPGAPQNGSSLTIPEVSMS